MGSLPVILILFVGSGCAALIEAVLKDKMKILPCPVYLQGEDGIAFSWASR